MAIGNSGVRTMSSDSLTPMALRSLEELGAIPDAALPIQRLGTTYAMAQDATWLDFDNFAVGRWDGTLSIFEKTASTMEGALVTTAVTTPSDMGVQMVEWIAPNTFVSSNGKASMVVWQAPDSRFEQIEQVQTLAYDASHGAANSASAAGLGDDLYVLTGHENGSLLIWQGEGSGAGLRLLQTVDLRRADSVNPWGLQNIRGVSWFLSDASSIKVVTGSENGEVCIVDVPSGKVLSRTLFNPAAKRGINAISVAGQNLLVANCSVGPADKNLWYYWIDCDDWSVALRESINLIVDTSRPQAFNFDVTWGMANGQIAFFSATEEGVLWMGILEDCAIKVLGYEKAAVADLGAALAAGAGNLAYVAYNVSSFDTDPASERRPGINPNRIDQAIG